MELDETKELQEYFKEYNHLLIMFYSTWCPPCKMQKPIVIEFMEYHEEANVLFINTDNYKDLAHSLDVYNVPTLNFYKNGELVESLDSFVEYEEIEEKYLELF